MNYIYFIFIFLAILRPEPAPAEMPDGASDPAFQTAVEVWLSDDDATSLPALARLATGGNHAAQILLGQIELHEVNSSHWVATLSRNERRALFRAPGGKFGKSWLAVAAEHSELARALNAARDFDRMEEAILDLAVLGEFGAMGPVISRLLNHGRWETLVELHYQGALPPERRYVAWYAAIFASSPNASRLRIDVSRSVRSVLLQSALYFTLAGNYVPTTNSKYIETYWPMMLFIANGEIDPDQPESAMLIAKALLDADETRPIASACRARCSTESVSCAETVWEMLGGYGVFLELGSPVATIIPPDRYEQSERATGELLRRLAQGIAYPSDRFNQVTERSLCLARALYPIIHYSEPER